MKENILGVALKLAKEILCGNLIWLIAALLNI